MADNKNKGATVPPRPITSPTQGTTSQSNPSTSGNLPNVNGGVTAPPKPPTSSGETKKG